MTFALLTARLDFAYNFTGFGCGALMAQLQSFRAQRYHGPLPKFQERTCAVHGLQRYICTSYANANDANVHGTQCKIGKAFTRNTMMILERYHFILFRLQLYEQCEINTHTQVTIFLMFVMLYDFLTLQASL